MTATTTQGLSAAQVAQFHERGYVAPIPVFSADEVRRFQAEYEKLITMLPPGKTMNFVNWWHKRNRFLYDLCMDPRLLDRVESILGPNFFLWGSHFFVKEPGDGTEVPWHQDAQYWPLSPQNAVTVFIAFTDCVRENACMRVIPGSHRGNILRHETAADEHLVLKQRVAAGQFDESDSVYLELQAGEISLHDDALLHGSAANHSQRRRVGFTMRFSSTDVKCDLNVWPNFQAFLARGVDEYRLNPIGTPPTGYDAPTGMQQ